MAPRGRARPGPYYAGLDHPRLAAYAAWGTPANNLGIVGGQAAPSCFPEPPPPEAVSPCSASGPGGEALELGSLRWPWNRAFEPAPGLRPRPLSLPPRVE